jgi:hypothetical protein
LGGLDGDENGRIRNDRFGFLCCASRSTQPTMNTVARAAERIKLLFKNCLLIGAG